MYCLLSLLQVREKAVKRFGVLLQILWDHGTQFKPARGETSAFDIRCCALGIERICVSVRRPSTCGKIEAFHKKRTRLSFTCSRSTGVSYVTTTALDCAKE